MNILITGSSGFIGRNLSEFFGTQYRVFCPAHKDLELLDEVAVRSFLQRHDIHMILHTAIVPSHRKAQESKDIAYRNIRMFFNLVRNTDIVSRIITYGSGSEYDVRQSLSRVREDDFDSHIPGDEGGFSKYICSKYIEKAERIVNLRCFGVFGKYEDYQMRFISNAICKTIFDLPITIKQNRVFSYLYIHDLCRITEYFLGHTPQHSIYNAAPAQCIDLFSIAQSVLQIAGKNLEIIIHAPGMGNEYSADDARLTQEVRGFEFTPLHQAIGELYRWYEEHKDIINKDCLLIDP